MRQARKRIVSETAIARAALHNRSQIIQRIVGVEIVRRFVVRDFPYGHLECRCVGDAIKLDRVGLSAADKESKRNKRREQYTDAHFPDPSQKTP